MPRQKEMSEEGEKVVAELREELECKLDKLMPLVDLIPTLESLAQEKRDQESFNRQAAKIGRIIVVLATGIGAVIGTVVAVSKLIVTLGK